MIQGFLCAIGFHLWGDWSEEWIKKYEHFCRTRWKHVQRADVLRSRDCAHCLVRGHTVVDSGVENYTATKRMEPVWSQLAPVVAVAPDKAQLKELIITWEKLSVDDKLMFLDAVSEGGLGLDRSMLAGRKRIGSP